MKDVKGMTVQSDNSKGRSGPLGISGGIWRLLIIPVLLCMSLPLGVSAFMFHNDAAHTGIYNDGGTHPNNVKLWNYTFTGPGADKSAYASPAVVDNVVYMGSLDKSMAAVYANNGTKIWSVDTADEVHASAAVVNHVVYFTTYADNLVALHDDGTPFWEADIGAPGHISPTVVNDVVYVGSDNGRVFAIGATNGTTIWTRLTNTTSPHSNFMHSNPAVVDNVVYIGNENTYNVSALNATTGAWIWNRTTGGSVYSSPAVVNNVVYVGSNDDYLYALNTANGFDHFAPYNTFGAVQSSPAVADGFVYVGNNYGILTALDKDLGTAKSGWPFVVTSTDQIFSSPAVANGIVYAGCYNGKLYAIDVNGTKIWEYSTGSYNAGYGLFSSPAVANGVVYVGGGDGNNNLFAIGNRSGVAQVPVAAFTANVTSGTAPLPVQFTNTSSNSPTSWNWSFRNVTGDNAQIWFSTVQNPVQTFGVGNFSIVLNASNSAGYNLSTQVTFINVTASSVAAMASKIGTYNPTLGIWYLDYNGNGAWDPATDKVYAWGATGYQPVTGNWDGSVDGKVKIGTYNPTVGIWYLDYNGNGAWDPATDKVYQWGAPGYQPVTGDWNADGQVEIGTYNPTLGIWYLDYNGNGAWDPATDKVYTWGATGYAPVIGKWS